MGRATLDANGWTVPPITAPGRVTGSAPRQSTIINIGDSIGAGSATAVNGNWQFGNTYIDLGIRMSGPQYRQIRNSGIGGQASTTILGRFAADVLAYRPDVVVIHAGTNDLIHGVADSVYTTLLRNLESMIRMALAAGILPVLCTLPPKGDASTSSNTSTATDEIRKSQPLYYALANHYGIPLFDAFRYLCNPANGAWREASYSADGIHPHPVAVEILAPLFADFLKRLPAPGPYLAAAAESNDGSLGNLIANGNFVNGSGGFGFWTLTTSSNSTRTQEAVPSDYYTGYTMKIVRGAGGQASIATASNLVGWSVGDVLRFSGRIKLSGLVPASATGVTVNLAGAGTSWVARPLSLCPNNGEFVFCMDTAPIPSGTSSINLTTITNDDAVTVEYNNLTVQNVTRMNAIHTPGT